MTKDEIRKLYVEATARTLALRHEAHGLQKDMLSKTEAYKEEHGTAPMTPRSLRDAAEEAIVLSGLPEDAHEVRALRQSVLVAVLLNDELDALDGRSSASQIGPVL